MPLNPNLRKRRSSESEVSDLDSIHWIRADLSVRKQPTHLATPPLVEVWGTTAEIPYWWRVTNQNWVVLLIGRNKFPSRQDQSELGSDASPVWNFSARFSDVFGGESSGDVATSFPGWWRRCSTCIFKGFWVDFWMTCSAGLVHFVKSPGWLSCHLITKLILVAFKLRCQELDKAIAEPRAMERIVFKVRVLYPDSDSSKEMQH